MVEAIFGKLENWPLSAAELAEMFTTPEAIIRTHLFDLVFKQERVTCVQDEDGVFRYRPGSPEELKKYGPWFKAS